MRNELEQRIAMIEPIDEGSMQRTQERLNDLTKPLGSLGDLEARILQMSGITRKVVPAISQPLALIFAADHGVTEEGVSAYGEEVTEEMAVNMCMGSAVSSVLARGQQVRLEVVDVGIRTRVRHPRIIERKVANGTNNFVRGAAMTREQAYQAVLTGYEVCEGLLDAGHDLVVLGEMGIGNTTASSAMIASLLGLPVEKVVGQGTGITTPQLVHKQDVIQRALDVNQPVQDDPWDVLRKVGGFEIAALAGAMLACAVRRVPIVLDGLITGVAALWAKRVCPQVVGYFLASHQSAEPAHAYLLKELEISPLVQWDMRLGEGSGGLFVLPILLNACKLVAETSTFEDARVTNPHKKRLREEGDGQEVDRAIALGGADATDTTTAQSLAPVRSDFTDEERAAVYKAILARRDIRVFLPDPVPEDVLGRILMAAHHAPSVGYMQPWNFILIREKQVLKQLQEEVERERVAASAHYQDLQKDYYLRLKLEGLMQAPLTICVTNDTSRGGPHVLGRNTIPETDLMSTSCAIENMWLAARAEGVAMGWVSIYQKRHVQEILHIPEHVEPVALLTVGYTPHFPDIPVLERVGWGKRLDLDTLVYQDRWGNLS